MIPDDRKIRLQAYREGLIQSAQICAFHLLKDWVDEDPDAMLAIIGVMTEIVTTAKNLDEMVVRINK